MSRGLKQIDNFDKAFRGNLNKALDTKGRDRDYLLPFLLFMNREARLSLGSPWTVVLTVDQATKQT